MFLERGQWPLKLPLRPAQVAVMLVSESLLFYFCHLKYHLGANAKLTTRYLRITATPYLTIYVECQVELVFQRGTQDGLYRMSASHIDFFF